MDLVGKSNRRKRCSDQTGPTHNDETTSTDSDQPKQRKKCSDQTSPGHNDETTSTDSDQTSPIQNEETISTDSDQTSEYSEDDSISLYRRFVSAACQFITTTPGKGTDGWRRLEELMRVTSEPSVRRKYLLSALLHSPSDNYTAVDDESGLYPSVLHWAASLSSADIVSCILSTGRVNDINIKEPVVSESSNCCNGSSNDGIEPIQILFNYAIQAELY